MGLLIYNKDHWYDTTTQKRRDELDQEFPGKFDSRYRKGDIVEVVEDGRYANQRSPAFAVVHIPGVKDLEYLVEPPQELVVFPGTKQEVRTFIKQRRYGIDMTKVSLDVDKKATLAKVEDLAITDKTIG